MIEADTIDAYGAVSEPATMTFQRLLPGPIERVWSYLTDSDLRSKWLASGAMEQKAGAAFELTWRNDELTDPPGARPEGFGDEHHMKSRIVEIDPPRKLVFTWHENGEITFLLKPAGDRVLLTLIHKGLGERPMRIMVGAGWHVHLDLLSDRISGRKTEQTFWDGWLALRKTYDERLPA